MASETKHSSIVEDWLEEESLMLLEGWARDGYTYEDIANRIGIDRNTLGVWRKKYPEINDALKKGREIVDYQVENALLKSALGYKTKEVKVTTIIRNGKTIETQRETTNKEFAPNVTACQVWLYNRLPDKWKKNRDSFFEDNEDDKTIQVIVKRPAKQTTSPDDEDWDNTVNKEIEISKNENESEVQSKQKKTKSAPLNPRKNGTNTTIEDSDEIDLDYWPDDWEDDEDWED